MKHIETRTVTEYTVLLTQEEVDGLHCLLYGGVGGSTLRGLGLSEMQHSLKALASAENPIFAKWFSGVAEWD